ncbi:cadherin-related family member 5-like isoform X3 [Sminthopsis crassicaudata]|uniref:cadherin-related family member 5-like isoform X3 n=1 Tax=Sminthopsis crassicaudata TaxID=9301 RepID=UPI003D69CA62
MTKRRLTWHTLLLTVVVTFHLNTAGTDQCMGGSNIFTEIPENSPNGSFVVNLTDFGDPLTSGLQLYLSGPDSHWFYLEGKTIRLNVSTEKTLDREVEYRVIIQVLNENDHQPRFQEDLLLPQNISELAALHSVVFTTLAEDDDGDSLVYSIDDTSPDAVHFRIDLPNSGRVVLAQPLDFETKRRLEVVIHAMEMSTRERYKCTTTVHINVLDGDDQYPSFLPCRPLGPQNSHVCLSPIYTVNITEGETPEGPLRFQPGDIYAEDGDRDLKAAISYSILAGADGDYFHMDNSTGALTMQREAPSSQLTSTFHLTVMVWPNKAAQVNDPRKYAVSEVLVRVLAANHHPPRFSLPHHTAFVLESPDTATLLVTYDGQVLSLHAVDPDFPNGVNPNLWYKLVSEGNHSQLFSVTRDGLLLAKPNQLQAQETYLLQVIAQDAESGEVANTTVSVEVLPSDQAVPPDPSELSSSPNMADRVVVVGSLSLAGLFLVTGFSLGIWALRRWQQHQECSKQTALADEKHPNVDN